MEHRTRLLTLACSALVLLVLPGCGSTASGGRPGSPTTPPASAVAASGTVVGVMGGTGSGDGGYTITVRSGSPSRDTDFLLTDSTGLRIDGKSVGGSAGEKEAAFRSQDALGPDTAVSVSYEASTQAPFGASSPQRYHIPVAASVVVTTPR